MATSAKDIFAADLFGGNMFAAGVWRGRNLFAVPSVPGAEFVLPSQAAGFAAPDQLPHCILPHHRGHYVIPEED